MKEVDTREYVSMLRDLVEDGHEVSLLIAGGSMSPFLVHHRDTIFFKKPDRPLRRGDMVFYQRLSGQFVMHRIYKVKHDAYYMVGDAQRRIEGPLQRQQIFALVTRVCRKGKTLVPGDFWWEFFEHVWIRIVPFRDWIGRVYAKLAVQRGKD